MGLDLETAKMLMWFQLRIAMRTGHKVKKFGIHETKKSTNFSLELGNKLTPNEVKELKKVKWSKVL